MKADIWYKCIVKGSYGFRLGKLYFFEYIKDGIATIDEHSDQASFTSTDDFDDMFTPATESEIREHLGEGEKTAGYSIANQPAFPQSVTCNENGIWSTFDANGGSTLGGLTKREHFASIAMQSLLVNYHAHGMYGNSEHMPLVAEESVRQADALISALNNKQE